MSPWERQNGTSRSSFPFLGILRVLKCRGRVSSFCSSFQNFKRYVTFKDTQGAETAILLSGATIVDMAVTIALAPDYVLPPSEIAPPVIERKNPSGPELAVRKTEDVVTGMLAKGFILGKDAVNKAKSFDEKHQLTSTASSKVASLDKKIGLT